VAVPLLSHAPKALFFPPTIPFLSPNALPCPPESGPFPPFYPQGRNCLCSCRFRYPFPGRAWGPHPAPLFIRARYQGAFFFFFETRTSVFLRLRPFRHCSRLLSHSMYAFPSRLAFLFLLPQLAWTFFLRRPIPLMMFPQLSPANPFFLPPLQRV